MNINCLLIKSNNNNGQQDQQWGRQLWDGWGMLGWLLVVCCLVWLDFNTGNWLKAHFICLPYACVAIAVAIVAATPPRCHNLPFEMIMVLHTLGNCNCPCCRCSRSRGNIHAQHAELCGCCCCCSAC